MSARCACVFAATIKLQLARHFAAATGFHGPPRIQLDGVANEADILDGLSQTLVVGERCSLLAPSTWVGEVPGGEHAPARICRVGTYSPNSKHKPVQYFHNFSTLHPAGTQFVSADGSVHLVAETIDEQVYQALCTRSAGDVVGKY